MHDVPPIVSIVLPAHNECMNLPAMVRIIQEEMEPFDAPYEIIVVDDGSSDGTWSVLSRLSHELESGGAVQLQGLQLSRNFGKESAVFAGLEAARGQAVIVIDCDLQHPPALLPRMIRVWQESHVDVVEAVKSDRGRESPARRLASELFYSLFHVVSGYNMRNSSDYKLLDRTVVNALLGMEERNLFFRGMVEWLGFKRHMLTFEVPPREGGISTWSTARLVRMAVGAMTAYSFVPLRLIAATGLLFLIVSLLLIVYTVTYKLLGLAVSGFTTVIVLQLVIGSLCMLSIGIAGEYIARIYEEVKRRPRYVVARRMTLDERDESQHTQDNVRKVAMR